MRKANSVILSIIGCIMTVSILFSCGQKKGRYEIDNLIADYAYESELETGVPSAQRDTSFESDDEATDIDEGEEEKATDSGTLEPGVPESAPIAPVAVKEGPRYHDRIKVRPLGRLAEVFNDSNHRQIAYAKKLGISPIRTVKDAYHTRRPVMKITSTSDYTVDALTHSLPYLVPEASRLLTAIGRNFKDSLRRRGADGYRIRVTSLLRTPHTVKRLRRVNINATDSSTHQFGTTFDISYRRFHCLDTTRTINEEDLKNLLAEVLYDLRRNGKCLVKFERKTGCFHVTVTD